MNRRFASRFAPNFRKTRTTSPHSGRAVRTLRFEALEARVVFSASVAAAAAKPGGGGTTVSVCNGYPLNDAVGQHLSNLAANHPTLAEVVSIGKSSGQRDLWAMHISDNVGIDESNEPAVSYTGTMHGNEPDGMTLSLDLIDELVTGYGQNPRITELVDNTDIWILPLMNPDGLASCTRTNAQGYDLNRSYPDLSADASQATNILSTPLTLSQLAAIAATTPETAAVMQWSAQHQFVLSADFHENGGYAVVNYPYDKAAGVKSGAYAKSPDDDLFKYISKVYSSHNHQMWDAASKKGQYGVPYVDGTGQKVTALTVNTTFPYGITNGSDWFAAGGTFQDWIYRYAGTNSVTVETRDDANFATSDELWNANRDSMLAYLQSVHVGTKGTVTGDGGTPLAASITITGTGTTLGGTVAVNQHFVFSDPLDGSFFRMLPPGSYPNLTITVSAPGYVNRTFSRSVEIADPRNSVVPPSASLPPLPALIDLGTIQLTRPIASLAMSAPATGGGLTATAPDRSSSTTPAGTTTLVTSVSRPAPVLVVSANDPASVKRNANKPIFTPLTPGQATDLALSGGDWLGPV